MSDIDMENVHAIPRSDGLVGAWLPKGAHVTAGVTGSVSVLLDRDVAEELFHALGGYLAGEDGRDFQIAADWGVEGGGHTEEEALAKLARLRTGYPTSNVRASWRVAVELPDGGEYYGPWQDLEPASEEEQP